MFKKYMIFLRSSILESFFWRFDLIAKDYFREGTTILLIHTGGLQGIEGMNQRIEKKGWRID